MFYVSVCVFLCKLYSLNDWANFRTFHTNSVEDMGRCRFSQSLYISQFDDVMVAILHFPYAALSRP